jgi:hypothetical protein
MTHKQITILKQEAKRLSQRIIDLEEAGLTTGQTYQEVKHDLDESWARIRDVQNIEWFGDKAALLQP